MGHIHNEASYNAPLAVTFGYVDDHRNTPDWMFGITSLTPVGPLDHGLGAVFEALFQVRPVKLHSTVRVVEWEQDALLSLESIAGFTSTMRWRFAAAGPDRTTVSVDFDYTVPGGMAGRALGRALEPVFAMSMRHTESTLRHKVEERYAAQRGED